MARAGFARRRRSSRDRATRLYAEPIRLRQETDSTSEAHQSSRPIRCGDGFSGSWNCWTEIQAVVDMLIENNNQDPMLRHAGSMAIAGLLAARRRLEELRNKSEDCLTS